MRRAHSRGACGEEGLWGLGMDDMYRDYILDHYKNPRNSGELPGATHTYHDSNPLCGDELTMQLRISDGHVDDVRFSGKRSGTSRRAPCRRGARTSRRSTSRTSTTTSSPRTSAPRAGRTCRPT